MGKDKSDAGENIKVAVRVRPLFQKEIDRGDKECVECDLASNQVIVRTETGSPYTWTFDFVFNKTFTQNDLFIQVIHPMIEAVMEGFNSTIFAYGQSGSGKTHTMTGVLGDMELEGIIPRSFHYIFGRIQDAPSAQSWRVFCSFLELYNGKCRDLLVTDLVSLAIREQADKSFFVQDLSMPEVRLEKELINYMEEGTARRCVGVTDLNAHSSRSHSVFTVYLEKTEASDNGDTRVVTSKLNLVDLAGSERQAKTNAVGDRLKEGANINLSLSALGTVIDSIVKGKGHIPFRSSPLTMLLKDSLGGGSKTVMFANVRPSNQDISETISTLRFADRAKQIKNKPKVQMDPKEARIAELMDEVTVLKAKLRKYENEGGCEGDTGAENEGWAARAATLELELEEARNAAELLATEVEQLKGAHSKQLVGIQAQVTAIEGRMNMAQQEKALVQQQCEEEKSHLSELQHLLLEFLEDVSPEVSITNGDNTFDITSVSKALDSLRERLHKTPEIGSSAVADAQDSAALANQRRKFEERELEKDLRHKAELEKLITLNNQSQEALNQAVTQMEKMKEGHERDKERTVEQHRKQMESLHRKHCADLQGLLAQNQELPAPVLHQLEADIADLQAQPLLLTATMNRHASYSEVIVQLPQHSEQFEPPAKGAMVTAARQQLQEYRSQVEGGLLDATPELKSMFLAILREGEGLADELATREQSRFGLQRRCTELVAGIELQANAQTHLEAEKEELQRSLDQVRAELMAEMCKNAAKTTEQVALVQRLDDVQSQLQNQTNEKQALQEELDALKNQLLNGGGEAEGLRQAFDEKEKQHAREMKRMAAQLQEKAVTLENNRKVMRTLHDLLDRKTQSEKELEEKVEVLQNALKGMEGDIQTQFREQMERLTQQNNRKIEALVAAHQQQLRKEQKEKEKLGKKLVKEKLKLEKVKERCDQQIVIIRELEDQLENAKEDQLRALHLDQLDPQIRNVPPNKSEPTHRQQELLSAKDRVLETEKSDAGRLGVPLLKNGNKRQNELLAQAGKNKDYLDHPRYVPGSHSPPPSNW